MFTPEYPRGKLFEHIVLVPFYISDDSLKHSIKVMLKRCIIVAAEHLHRKAEGTDVEW